MKNKKFVFPTTPEVFFANLSGEKTIGELPPSDYYVSYRAFGRAGAQDQ